jgi:hypothetical protein
MVVLCKQSKEEAEGAPSPEASQHSDFENRDLTSSHHFEKYVMQIQLDLCQDWIGGIPDAGNTLKIQMSLPVGGMKC